VSGHGFSRAISGAKSTRLQPLRASLVSWSAEAARVPSGHRRYLEASQNPCGWLGVRRWREEAPASVGAKRPSRAKASTAALDPIACRRFFDGQRRALGHPAGAFGPQSTQAVCFDAVAT